MSCVREYSERGSRTRASASKGGNTLRERRQAAPVPPPAITLLSVILSPPSRQRPIYHGGVSVLAPRQSRLNSRFAAQSFLYKPPSYRQVYSLIQRNVTDRIMSQIMSLEAYENCSLAK